MQHDVLLLVLVIPVPAAWLKRLFQLFLQPFVLKLK